MASVTWHPLSEHVGVEARDVDLNALGDDTFGALRAAVADHGVLFIRDQSLTPEQHIAFARRWGEIDINRYFPANGGHPEIAEVRKAENQQTNIGGGWHTDHTYDTEPALGSMLYAHEVPSKGGDTQFASMYLAFETLSEGLKDTLRGLRARHSSRHVFGTDRAKRDDDTVGRIKNPELATQDAVHPVVITHPLSGREALYVNAGFTLGFQGWTDEESKPLLDYLYAHASRPEFTCRFQWKPGSLAFWDNRATWHQAINDYQGERRLMHRITLEGEALG